MLAYPITYTDFDGNVRTETYHFNLSPAECITLDVGVRGGVQKLLERIVEETDGERMMEMFRKVVLGAVGKKSLDGRKFIKSQEISDDFEQTNAYSVLMLQMLNSAEMAGKFFNGILPSQKELETFTKIQEANKAMADNPVMAPLT